MPMFSTIIGWSFVGLAARFGQLGIQKRNLFSNPGGHFISMGVWGFAGYWAYKWETYSGHLLDVKRAEIADRRRRLMDQADEASGVAIVGDRPVPQSH